MKRYLSIMLLCLLPLPAMAVNVFACEPQWAALVRQLGGDAVQVTVAIDANQDPHHVQARPSLISGIRSADLVVCTGGSLEVGWLPVLLSQGANPDVAHPPGLFYADRQIELLNKPTVLDRAKGDIHPDGNPHAHLDPHRLLQVAKALSMRLQIIDPEHAKLYQQRWADFSQRWKQAIAKWEKQAAPLKGEPVIVHHDEWIYLLNWLGMTKAGSLEPKPGFPPTPSHLAQLINVVKATDAELIVYAPHNSPDASNWLAAHTDACAVQLPFTVGGSDKAVDLFSLYENTIQRLLAASGSCNRG
ncbi:MAG: zinc ABC transporter substrate-binding protein [Salinisphaera sp.]|nr:zinc ABC transporter substrate-binding protein [Salinisphaera sp.]